MSSSSQSLHRMFAGLRLATRPVAPVPSYNSFASSSSSSSLSQLPSGSSSFHSSAVTLISRRKFVARRKKAKVLALREDRARSDVRSRVDSVSGEIQPATYGSSRPGSSAPRDKLAGGTKKYAQSLLQKAVIDRNDIWYAQPPQYPSREQAIERANADQDVFPKDAQPKFLSNGLTSSADRELLFNHLPRLSAQSELTAQMNSDTAPRGNLNELQDKAIAKQAENSEQLMRILDLRNADAKGIRTFNVRRIVEVFGSPESSDTEQPANFNTGSPEVQAAILTHRIRLLADHLERNKRDIHNRKSLRTLVHQRANILRYMRKRALRKDGGHEGGKAMAGYLSFLDDIGVDRRAVEGEVIVR